MKIQLECHEADFDALWVAASRRGKRVEVDRRALAALLRDHSRVLQATSARVVNPYPPATLARAQGGAA
jgi:hypothetical protein